MIPESFVVNAAQRDMRELTRSRLGLAGDTVAPRNRIHAIVARYPYKRPSCGLFTDGGLEWLQSLSLSETDRLGVDTHLAKLVFLRGRIARYEKRIAEIARDDPRARLLMTIPGIGCITAVTILAEIVDHGRFASAEKLVSYAGLSPKHHNSGETVRTGGITKRGSVWLRTAMVEAAFVAVRHDARIGARYQKLAARIGSMKARVATARVMLEWVWEMLNSGTEYRGIDRELVRRKMQRTRRVAESQA